MDRISNEFLDNIEKRIEGFVNIKGKEAHIAELIPEYVKHRPEYECRYLMYSQTLIDLFNFKQAIKISNGVINKGFEKNVHPYYMVLGDIFNRLTHLEEADKYFQLTIQLGNEDSSFYKDTWIFKGANLSRLGKFDEALACHQKVIDNNWTVQLDEAWLNRGLILRAQGEYEQAREAFEEAIKIDPDYEKTKLSLKGLIGIEKTLETRDKLCKQKHPSETELQQCYRLAKDYYKQDEMEIHSLEIIYEFLRKQPDHWGAWSLYGNCLQHYGRTQEAEEAYNRALDLTDDFNARMVLIYFQLGQLNEYYISREIAEEWYQRSTDESEKIFGGVWNTRGMNLLMLEEHSKALDCFKKVIESNEKPAKKEEAYYLQGLVFRSMRNYGYAISSFQQALEIDPENKKAKIALDGLEGIEETLKIRDQLRQDPTLH